MTRIGFAPVLYSLWLPTKLHATPWWCSFLSEACLFFSDDLLRFRLQSVQYDLQHDFASVADEADRSVVLALLQVAFLWKCDDQGLGPRGWPFSCLIDFVADCRESGDYILSTCLDQFC